MRHAVPRPTAAEYTTLLQQVQQMARHCDPLAQPAAPCPRAHAHLFEVLPGGGLGNAVELLRARRGRTKLNPGIGAHPNPKRHPQHLDCCTEAQALPSLPTAARINRMALATQHVQLPKHEQARRAAKRVRAALFSTLGM